MQGWDDRSFNAYLAGFLDGEGHVSATQQGRRVVSITIANCHLGVLEAIRNRLTYGDIRWQQQRPHWTRRYVWVTKRPAECEDVLRRVTPYLRIRRHQAAAAMAAVSAMREARACLTRRDLAIREAVAAGEQGKSVALRFGVSPQSVSRILKGQPITEAGQFKGWRTRVIVAPVAIDPGHPESFTEATYWPYLAGIIDGEGYLTPVTSPSRNRRLIVTNTHRPALEDLAAYARSGTVRESSVTGNRKPCYRWTVHGRHELTALLSEAAQWMIVKREQARALLAEHAELMTYRATHPQPRGWHGRFTSHVNPAPIPSAF